MADQSQFRTGWFAQFVLRRRLLFYERTSGKNAVETPTAPAGYFVSRRPLADVLGNPEAAAWVPNLLRRADLGSVSIDVFLLCKKENGSVVGVALLLKGRGGAVWYDNVPLLPGEARLAGLLVDTEHRGLGLGTLLQRLFYFTAIAEPDVRLVSAVVESHRIPSIRAQSAVFSSVTTNWLFKIAGRNVVSWTVGGEHRGVWYVGPGRNRKMQVDD